MVALGVNPALASTQVYDSRSVGALELDSRLISRIAFAGNGRVVYSWVTEKDFEELNISRDETEGLPSILRSVEGTEVAILLREEKGRIRVNLRAKGECDVGAFAQRFDGGGHKAAAGFTMHSSLKEAEELILKAAGTCFCEQAE
jgi:phosphoesterase RecJ-like protein